MVNLVRWNPFDDIEEIQKQFFGENWSRPTLFAPTTDVYLEGDKQMVVEAHLPGFNDNDVDISVHEGLLEIRAEKRDSEEDKSKKKYVMRETASSFYRRVRLPKQANEAKIDAHMADGMLKVVVPLKELAKPKKIAIKSKNPKK
jgi:HSP20 family protein